MDITLRKCPDVMEGNRLVDENERILMYDEFSCRYFLSTKKKIKEIADKFNEKLIGEHHLSSGDVLYYLYKDLGLPHDEYLWDLCDYEIIEPIESIKLEL